MDASAMKKPDIDKFRQFSTEAVARGFAAERLKAHFDFYEEVGMLDRITGKRFRIDALTVCRDTDHVIGWEFKKSHLFKKEFGRALNQALDYRLAVISDTRLPQLSGQRIEACIVFPDWHGMHETGENEYDREAAGMRFQASYKRVGCLTQCAKGSQKLSITIGESAVWHSTTGWTGNAKGVLSGQRRFGATKAFDT
jgi:hypothetical protein